MLSGIHFKTTKTHFHEISTCEVLELQRRYTEILQFKKKDLKKHYPFCYFFQVMFVDLAFIRFVVVDASTSHTVSQRIVPLKCLRTGNIQFTIDQLQLIDKEKSYNDTKCIEILEKSYCYGLLNIFFKINKGWHYHWCTYS